MMKYGIKCWIPAEPEEAEEELYTSRGEAQKALRHYHFLQPENIYKLERIQDKDNERRGAVSE